MSDAECPSLETLRRLCDGSLSDVLAEDTSSHLDTCPECQQKLEKLTVPPLPGVPAAQPFIGEPGLQRAEEKIRELISDQVQTDQALAFPSGIIPRNFRNYELLDELGTGGMGVVYLARQTQLGRLVAVKMLMGTRGHHEESVKRFQREMQAVGQLDHPNIVRALDADQSEGVHFLVMEYVPGVDLSQLVRTVGDLPIPAACELIRQTALGLDHAHSRGLIHRDIKPSNLMLGETESGDFQVKILDLGLAQLTNPPTTDELTKTGQMMGTLEYMAPEQMENSGNVGPLADIYSLGSTFYKLLSGEAPFPCHRYTSPLQLMKAVTTESAVSLSTRRPLPEQLEELVHSMIALDPGERPGSAAEVAQALSPFTEGHDFSALLKQSRQTEKPKKTFAVETFAGGQFSTEEPKPHPEIVKTQPAFSRRTLGLTLGVCSLILAGIILLLPSKHGFIQVEILASDLQVTVDGEDRYLVTGKDTSFEVRPGKHKLFITIDETTFQTKEFAVTRKGTTALRVKKVHGNKLQVLNGEKVLNEYQLEELVTDTPKANPQQVKDSTKTPARTEKPQTPNTTEADASARNRKFANHFLKAGQRRLRVRIGERDLEYYRGPLPSGEPVQVLLAHFHPATKATDEDFRLLIESRLEHLHGLRFENQNVPVKWMEALSRTYPNLTTLHGFPAKPEYLPAFRRFQKLNYHEIGGTTAEAAALWTQTLCEKPDLVYLFFKDSRIEQAGLEYLTQAKGITTLNFLLEYFEDSGLKVIGKVNTLETLIFTNHQGKFSRDGLMHLSKLTKLKQFTLDKCKVSAADLAALKRELPQCRIVMNGRLITSKSTTHLE